jgi:DNA-binding MarR family transcriptional regulator
MSKVTPNSEGAITLGLLKAVGDKPELTQRSLANELGIALGLVNTYLKRCISKGYIKTRQIPSRRYAYYLTPQGFAEKSKLAAEYFYQSLSLFRQAHVSYKLIFDACVANGWSKICLCGCGDLADIAILLSAEANLTIVGIFEPSGSETVFHGLPVYRALNDVPSVEGWIVTSHNDAQGLYDELTKRISRDLVLIPTLLDVRMVPVEVEV